MRAGIERQIIDNVRRAMLMDREFNVADEILVNALADVIYERVKLPEDIVHRLSLEVKTAVRNALVKKISSRMARITSRYAGEERVDEDTEIIRQIESSGLPKDEADAKITKLLNAPNLPKVVQNEYKKLTELFKDLQRGKFNLENFCFREKSIFPGVAMRRGDENKEQVAKSQLQQHVSFPSIVRRMHEGQGGHGSGVVDTTRKHHSLKLTAAVEPPHVEGAQRRQYPDPKSAEEARKHLRVLHEHMGAGHGRGRGGPTS